MHTLSDIFWLTLLGISVTAFMVMLAMSVYSFLWYVVLSFIKWPIISKKSINKPFKVIPEYTKNDPKNKLDIWNIKVIDKDISKTLGSNIVLGTICEKDLAEEDCDTLNKIYEAGIKEGVRRNKCNSSKK